MPILLIARYFHNRIANNIWKTNSEAVIIVEKFFVTVLRWNPRKEVVVNLRTVRARSKRRNQRSVSISVRQKTVKITPPTSHCYRARMTYLWFRSSNRWTKAQSELFGWFFGGRVGGGGGWCWFVCWFFLFCFFCREWNGTLNEILASI
jgi:hypothetical protein